MAYRMWSWQWWHTCLYSPALERQRQADLKASLVNKASSRTKKPCLEKLKKRKKGRKKKNAVVSLSTRLDVPADLQYMPES